MQRLEVSGAVRPIYGSLGFKRLRRVGRTGPMAWPPRSPDLNPLEDFFSSLGFR